MDHLRQRLRCCAQVRLLRLSIRQATPQLINIQSAEGSSEENQAQGAAVSAPAETLGEPLLLLHGLHGRSGTPPSSTQVKNLFWSV